MGFRTEDVIAAARVAEIRKSATSDSLLVENRQAVTASATTTFDDFLSHSHADKQIVVGLKALLEQAGRTVYVDWIVSPNPVGTPITVANAKLVRNAMDRCRRLVYLHTVNSNLSKWCPWELGYFDALKRQGNRIAYVSPSGSKGSGQEYLDLYTELDRFDLNK